MSTSLPLARLSLTLLLIVGVAISHQAAAKALTQLPQEAAAYEVINRTLNFEGGGVVHLNAAQDDGIAWLVGETFTEGRISIEVRGVDVPQRSFVGLAFHGGGRDLFDTVYTRPFNFNAADPARRSHSLQYMSVPDNTWDVLREKFPGKYEAALTPPPAAESWVRLTLDIKSRHLRVFVDDASAPALVVDLINERLKGRVGLWVGNNSEGWFRNLTISPAVSAAKLPPAAAPWRDEFDSLDSVDTWLVQLYSFDASGANFVPGMLTTRNSILRITTEKNARSDLPKKYNGGDLGTNTFRSYGMYRARLRPAAARGSVTAFFLMNRWQPINWEHKEIDIEFLGKDPRKVQLTTHDFQKGGTVWKNDSATIDLPFDWSEDFHEYSILWTAKSVKWFVDGKLLHQTMKYVPHEPLQIRANLYVGDVKTQGIEAWLGSVHDEDLPAHADFDWVSFTPLE